MTHNGRNQMITYWKFVRRMRGFYFVVLSVIVVALAAGAYWGTWVA